MPSREEGRFASFVGSRAWILPDVRVDLTGRIRNRVRRGIHESSTVAQLATSLRENRDT